MKRMLVLVVFLLAEKYSSAHAVHDIDQELKKEFHILFPHAQRESWLENADTYVVYFINEGIRERVFYQKDRSVIKLIRYYLSEDLPANIRLQLIDRFPGKKVFGVVEISLLDQSGKEGAVQYQITMEDEYRWYQVVADGREAPRVLHRYGKS